VATVQLGPAQVDLAGVRAGDQNALTLTITSKGKPFNLTGKAVAASARASVLDSVSLDAVIDITNALGGIVTARWPGDAVTQILAGKATWQGVWDLQVQGTGEDAQTLVEGSFTAVMDVTRTS
jgi:hypothetical protein